MTALGRHLATIPGPQFTAGLARLSPAELQESLVERFRYDREHFIKWLWPEAYARPFARYHRDILAREKTGWKERVNSGSKTLRALAAPRSTSKTGITCADLAHDVLYGLERVVPVLSAELTLSRTSLATIRELLSAPTVTDLYGPVTFKGGVDRYTATTARGYSCTFIAKSFGTSVRGLKEGMIRPTRLIVDDGEDKLRVNNPDIRRDWWDFLQADILKLGDIAGGLIIDWLGTILHPDSVLAKLLKADGDGAGWESERYQACESWPEGPARPLWDACGRVWGDLSIGNLKARRAAARAFYEAHRADMDRGARMLSDDWISLFSFYETIWSEGMGSVLKELQNEPRDPNASIFTSSTFPRCRIVTMPDGEPAVQRLDARGQPEGAPVRRRDLRVTLRLDPIPADDLGGLGGGAGGSDYAAIAAIGRDSQDRAYVLDGWMSRVRDSQQIAALWPLAEKWRPISAKIESNGFQRMFGRDFRRMRDERAAKGLFHQLAVAETKDSVETSSKNNDIAALQPTIGMGWLYFAEHLPQEGMLQFDAFPNGDHDDFPDVVARGYRDAMAGGRAGMVASFGR